MIDWPRVCKLHCSVARALWHKHKPICTKLALNLSMLVLKSVIEVPIGLDVFEGTEEAETYTVQAG